MTVKLESTISRWIGLSTDTKPSSSVQIGSTFFEYDTKLLYKCYDGENWTPLSLSYGLAFFGTCNSDMTQSTTTIVCSDLSGYGNDYFNTKFYLQVIKNANSVGNAPEFQVRQITDYVSTTGTFTTAAFSTNVQASDEVMILHESIVAMGRDDGDNAFDSSTVVANEDGSVLERLEWLQVAIGGPAGQLRTAQSITGVVEENAYAQFHIGLMDYDSGAIASGSIDITAIVVELAKSTGGAAFSAVGITQPTFSKADGRVYTSNQFLTAEWEVGDVYRLTVSGITVTIGGVTAYVPQMVWNDMVMEALSLDSQVAAIQTDIGNPSARTNLQSIEAMIGVPDAASSSLYDGQAGNINAVNRAKGKDQVAVATFNLNQAAATYTLFTCTTQPVFLEEFWFILPNVNVADDVTITGISVQTNDATPQVIISSDMGLKINLTAEGQLGWTGGIYLGTGKLITCVIYGGASDASTACTVVAKYRSTVNLGYLA